MLSHKRRLLKIVVPFSDRALVSVSFIFGTTFEGLQSFRVPLHQLKVGPYLFILSGITGSSLNHLPGFPESQGCGLLGVPAKLFIRSLPPYGLHSFPRYPKCSDPNSGSEQSLWLSIHLSPEIRHPQVKGPMTNDLNSFERVQQGFPMLRKCGTLHQVL